MADTLYFSDAVKIDGGEILTLDATAVFDEDAVKISEAPFFDAESVFTDSVALSDAPSSIASLSHEDSVLLSDTFDFITNILNLAQRVFTLRVRE